MPLLIPCPHCDRIVDLPDDYLGAGVRCPRCAVIFAVQQTGITAQAPPDADNLPYEIVGPPRVKPYMLPRSARYLPDRGKRLVVLGGTSIGLSVLGLVAGTVVLGSAMLFGLPAFVLGLTAWVLGQWDMEKIRRASMDPYADRMTNLGWVSGIVGTLLAVTTMLCGLGGLYLLMAKSLHPIIDG
jgi:hypothetical protein